MWCEAALNDQVENANNFWIIPVDIKAVEIDQLSLPTEEPKEELSSLEM